MPGSNGNGKGHFEPQETLGRQPPWPPLDYLAGDTERAALWKQLLALTERSAALWRQQSQAACESGACFLGKPWEERRRLHQQALDTITRLRAPESPNADLLRHAAYHHCGLEEWQRALDICKQLAKAAPDDAWVLRIQADALEGLGDWEAQAACLERLLEVDGADARDFWKLGLLRSVIHGHAHALEVLEQGLERFPDDPRLSQWLYICLIQCGEHARALPLAEKATQNEPEKFGGWVALGHAQEALRNPEDARAAFEHAFALAPGKANVFSPLLRVLREQGRWEELDATLAKAKASLDKEDIEGLCLARHFFRRGRMLQALGLALGPCWMMTCFLARHWYRLPGAMLGAVGVELRLMRLKRRREKTPIT